MTKSLILVSHGRFCEELKGSTEMIMGPQDNIHAVALLPEDGPDRKSSTFNIWINTIQKGNPHGDGSDIEVLLLDHGNVWTTSFTNVRGYCKMRQFHHIL